MTSSGLFQPELFYDSTEILTLHMENLDSLESVFCQHLLLRLVSTALFSFHNTFYSPFVIKTRAVV